MYIASVAVWLPNQLSIGRLLVGCHKDEREREREREREGPITDEEVEM